MIQKPKGTYDIYGENARQVLYLRKLIQALMDKYNYKYQNKLNFNKSEKYFFELEEMKKIMKEVNKKRFM